MADAVPESYVALAVSLADAAGEKIRPYFRTAVAVDAKPDATPVTIADREAERAMREIIARQAPEHGIIGEEEGRTNADAESWRVSHREWPPGSSPTGTTTP